MRIIALLSVLAAMAGCATPPPQIAVDYDEGHDFSRYATYALDDVVVKSGNPLVITPDTLRAVEEAVRAELDQKGYREVEDPSEADLGVRVFVALTEKVENVTSKETVTIATDRSVRVAGAPRVRRGGVAVRRSDFEEISLDPLKKTVEEGTMAIVFNHIPSGAQVFRVNGRREMTNQAVDGSNAERVVDMLLKEFPKQGT